MDDSDKIIVEKGVLVKCNEAVREYIYYLDEKENVILRRLDDKTLLLRADASDYVQKAMNEHFESNYYETALDKGK